MWFRLGWFEVEDICGVLKAEKSRVLFAQISDLVLSNSQDGRDNLAYHRMTLL